MAVSERASTRRPLVIRARSSAITRVEAVAQRLDAADDARAAAERHDRDPLLDAQLEQRPHLGGGLGIDDRVGRRLGVPGAHPDEVGIALAGGVQRRA